MSDIETGNKRAAMHDRRVVASTAPVHLVGGGVGARWRQVLASSCTLQAQFTNDVVILFFLFFIYFLFFFSRGGAR